MAEPSRLLCRTLRPDELSAYLAFARAAWGQQAPQASPQRLEWLYQHNPHSKGLSRELFVAFSGDQLVACHHRLRLPWRLNGQRLLLPSLHDLMALPDHRSGAGLQLIMAALGGEKLALLAGLSPAAEQIYARLKAPPLPCVWHRRPLNPLAAARDLLRQYLAWPAPSQPPPASKTWEAGPYQLTLVPAPDATQLELALSLPPPQGLCPDWDLPTYTWRFFHPAGPRHRLLLVSRAGNLLGRLVFSLGVRKGFTVARPVDAVVRSRDHWPVLLREGARAMALSGAALGLSATTDPAASLLLDRQGWKRRPDPPGCRLFSRGPLPASPTSLWGGAWDFGLDA